MKRLYLALLFLASLSANSQEFKNYDWGKPETYKPAENEKDLGEITILDKQIVEFVTNKNEAYDFVIHHTKTFVSSDEAIERNNKVYIPFKGQNEQLVSQKVRVIKPDGKVVEISDKDIQEKVDESRNIKIKYFALKGLEKNSVIEELIITKYLPTVEGSTEVIQTENLIKNYSYELIYPQHLDYEIRTYNGVPNFTENKSAYKDKTSQKMEMSEIPALKDEEYSNFIYNAKKFSYKLPGNHYTAKYNLFSYKDFVDDIFGKTLVIDSKAQNAVEKFIKGIPKGANTEENIVNVENFIKKSIQFDEHYGGQTDVSTTLANRFTNSYGLLKLYNAIFEKMQIKNQVVIVSNRFKNPIDPKFDLYKNLDDFTFYFPEQKGYVAPSQEDARFPILPYKWTNSYALFLKKTEFGGAVIPDFDLKKIQTPGVDFTHDEMNIDVDFSQSSSRPKVNTTINFNGYTANQFQHFYDIIPKDKIDLFEKDMVENYCGQKDNVAITTENRGLENSSKPFVMKASFEGNNLTEKVADKILFKVGQTIGKQTQLYQKDKRQLPLELEYPHGYTRTITIKLPQGYTVKNEDQIDSNFVVNNDGKDACKFFTTHTLKDGVLTINNIEQYKEVNLPITVYDDYVKVINGAADFNKLVLVLQKQ